MSIVATDATPPDAPSDGTTAAGAHLHAVVIDGRADFDLIRREWQALVEAVPGAPWLCYPEVFSTWMRNLRPTGRTRIVVVRDAGGVMKGLMPISFDFAWRGPAAAPRFDYDPRDGALIHHTRPRPVPVRQMTTMSSIPATVLWVGPLCQPADTATVCRAMTGAIRGQRRWWACVIPAIEGEDAEHWRDAFAAAGSPVRLQKLDRVVQDIRNLRPFDDIVAEQKKKFRQNVRRARAEAEKAGLKFEFVSGRQEVSARFGLIEDIARASWKHEGRDSTDVHLRYEGEQQAFFERLIGSETLGAEPVLATVADEEGVLAVLLMLRHGASLTALLTFWDGRQARASPGLLLLGESIDWAAREGLAQYDFNATADWVRYIVDSRRVVCNVVAFAPSLMGRVLAGVSGLAQRLR